MVPPSCPPSLKTPSAHAGEGTRGAGAGGGAERAAGPARAAPGAAHRVPANERRRRSLCPDPGPPPAAALRSAAARPPRLRPPQWQKLFVRSVGWWVARWGSALRRGWLMGPTRQQESVPGSAAGSGSAPLRGVPPPPSCPWVPRLAWQNLSAVPRSHVPRPVAWPLGPGGDNSEGPSDRGRVWAVRFRQDARPLPLGRRDGETHHLLLSSLENAVQ